MVRLYADGELESMGSSGHCSARIQPEPLEDWHRRPWLFDVPGGGMDGKIDDVRVYNRPLSPAEIQALYNAAP